LNFSHLISKFAITIDDASMVVQLIALPGYASFNFIFCGKITFSRDAVERGRIFQLIDSRSQQRA